MNHNPHPVFFSVIIPAYNAASYLSCSIESVISQGLPSQFYEIILIDDCSTDNTSEILAQYAKHTNLKIGSTEVNSGPGIARNIGVNLAIGEWIIFLDSDDQLLPDALTNLKKEISGAEAQAVNFDAVGFNWAYLKHNDSKDVLPQGIRKDHVYLSANKDILLQRYLSLQMDGSVIFTAVRRKLLVQHKLKFKSGIHEDIDYLFYIYWHASAVRYVDEILYAKVERHDSIVNTISERHLKGFIRAWRDIGQFIVMHGGDRQGVLRDYFVQGLIAVVATRLRAIVSLASLENSLNLYGCLFDECNKLVNELGLTETLSSTNLNTKYGLLADRFFDQFKNSKLSADKRAAELTLDLTSILSKSWSCTDLHHSVFLGPDQIRTCCKRFFRNGEIRGDVVLVDIDKNHAQQVSSAEILSAKQSLYDSINKGEKTDCDGCPFLEYKEWEPLNQLDIRYLSLEYHSICNLKCTYCSDTYYGGEKAAYDVPALVDGLIGQAQLAKCQNVVWGGGEPVIGANFTPLIEKLVHELPLATHRVLTNSVKYSKTVERLLEHNRISVTTSIDAGSSKVFAIVRGRSKLTSVMRNIQKYVALQPRRVTVKYIFTKENSTFDEVRGFIELLNEYGLDGCSFQISSDFKEECISLELAVLMISMYGMLVNAGFKSIFFDDLLRHRLNEIHSESHSYINTKLKSVGLESIIARHQKHPQVVIWGAGWQAKYMIEKSNFFKYSEICFFVDDTPSKIGTSYFQREVRSPDALLQCDLPVVIAAAQGYPFIYDALRRLGVSDSRLITSLIF